MSHANYANIFPKFTRDWGKVKEISFSCCCCYNKLYFDFLKYKYSNNKLSYLFIPPEQWT